MAFSATLIQKLEYTAHSDWTCDMINFNNSLYVVARTTELFRFNNTTFDLVASGCARGSNNPDSKLVKYQNNLYLATNTSAVGTSACLWKWNGTDNWQLVTRLPGASTIYGVVSASDNLLYILGVYFGNSPSITLYNYNGTSLGVSRYYTHPSFNVGLNSLISYNNKLYSLSGVGNSKRSVNLIEYTNTPRPTTILSGTSAFYVENLVFEPQIKAITFQNEIYAMLSCQYNNTSPVHDSAGVTPRLIKWDGVSSTWINVAPMFHDAAFRTYSMDTDGYKIYVLTDRDTPNPAPYNRQLLLSYTPGASGFELISDLNVNSQLYSSMAYSPYATSGNIFLNFFNNSISENGIYFVNYFSSGVDIRISGSPFTVNKLKGTIPFYFRLTDNIDYSLYTSATTIQRLWSLTNTRTNNIEYFTTTSASVEYCISADSILNDTYNISLSATV